MTMLPHRSSGPGMGGASAGCGAPAEFPFPFASLFAAVVVGTAAPAFPAPETGSFPAFPSPGRETDSGGSVPETASEEGGGDSAGISIPASFGAPTAGEGTSTDAAGCSPFPDPKNTLPLPAALPTPGTRLRGRRRGFRRALYSRIFRRVYRRRRNFHRRCRLFRLRQGGNGTLLRARLFRFRSPACRGRGLLLRSGFVRRPVAAGRKEKNRGGGEKGYAPHGYAPRGMRSVHVISLPKGSTPPLPLCWGGIRRAGHRGALLPGAPIPRILWPPEWFSPADCGPSSHPSFYHRRSTSYTRPVFRCAPAPFAPSRGKVSGSRIRNDTFPPTLPDGGGNTPRRRTRPTSRGKVRRTPGEPLPSDPLGTSPSQVPPGWRGP